MTAAAPLLIRHLLWRMRNVHPEAEVVTYAGARERMQPRRETFVGLADRCEQLAASLIRARIGCGSTVAVLAWNTHEHLELMLAVPAVGARVNSINVRMSGQVVHRLVFDTPPEMVVVDAGLADDPGELGHTARRIVTAALALEIPVISIGRPHRYAGAAVIVFEDLLTASAGEHQDETTTPQRKPIQWPDLSEDDTAYLFHTGGTTGTPKTYRVSHRAAMLHILAQLGVDATGLSRTDRVLPLAPLFHVNSWGLPLTALMTGASLVLTGRDMGAERLAEILSREKITVGAAVPTVWHDVCAAVREGRGPTPRSLREVLTGGSPVPSSLVTEIRRVLGASVANAWGMTETLACTTYERDRPESHAGLPIPLVELRLTEPGAGDALHRPPVRGSLQVRGPLVVAEPTEPDGWFDTGDIATFAPAEHLVIHDRAKALIKSGGEWISSTELEQHLCTHPWVASAAVVAKPDPRWIERPVAFVVLRGDSSTQTMDHRTTTQEVLRSHLAERVPRWWLPEQIIVIDELPTTGVGKIDKRALQTLVPTSPKEAAPCQ